jgi:hypothetical protein
MRVLRAHDRRTVRGRSCFLGQIDFVRPAPTEEWFKPREYKITGDGPRGSQAYRGSHRWKPRPCLLRWPRTSLTLS